MFLLIHFNKIARPYSGLVLTPEWSKFYYRVCEDKNTIILIIGNKYICMYVYVCVWFCLRIFVRMWLNGWMDVWMILQLFRISVKSISEQIVSKTTWIYCFLCIVTFTYEHTYMIIFIRMALSSRDFCSVLFPGNNLQYWYNMA